MAVRLAAKRERLLRNIRRDCMSTTPEDALLLRILIQASGARRGIEIGVWKGHGAIHMGIGFERTGGVLYSVEIDPEKAAIAEANVRKAGLEKTVKVICGDALEVLPRLRGKFDFLFIDAEKRSYLGYLKAAEPKLAQGAIIVADNVIVHAREMRDFLRYVANTRHYETVIVRASEEKGDGMSVSYKLF